ncbi:conserved hypothetical protein [Vibrio coralliirubri]|uniref:hypothetical protein n=1 Tax=Vibrio coralliirubri TaxID=1516159 RepID=UPI000636BE32|nr:hypothetical protein [Vibrio coralliirubri]CDT62352.1 conserved hypothetical protein [Vibrio coralliirubri]
MTTLNDGFTNEISDWSSTLKADLDWTLKHIKLGSRPKFITQVAKFSKALPEILTHLSIDDQYLIQKSGLSALNDQQLWSRLEYATEKVGIKQGQRRGCELTIFVGFVMRTFGVNNEGLLRPSMFIVDGANNSDISSLYRISVSCLWEFKELIHGILDSHKNPYNIQRIARDSASAIVVLSEDPDRYKILLNSGIYSLISNKEIINQSIESKGLTIGEKKALVYISRRLSPENFSTIYLPKIQEGKRYWINLLNTRFDVSRLGQLASILVKQAQEYTDYYMKNNSTLVPQKAKEIPIHIRHLNCLGITLHVYQHLLSSKQKKLIKSNGFKSFLNNNGELILLFWGLRKKAVTKRDRNTAEKAYSILFSCVKHFSGVNFDIRDYLSDYYIKTPSETSIGKFDYIEITSLFNYYPALARDIRAIYLSERSSFKSYSLDNSTISGRILNFQVLMNQPIKLSHEQREWLSNEGVAGFVKNNHSILKIFLEYLQGQSKSGALLPTTADDYQRSLKWVIQSSGFDVVDVYPVKVTQKSLYEQRQNSNTEYTKNEIIELAYYIEVLLNRTDLNIRDKIYVRLAKILLKTGWNASPLTNLETTDIIEVDSPLSANKTYFVRLFKKRAGYSTNWYKFDLTSQDLEREGIEIGKSVNSVIKELFYLSSFTNEVVRKSLPENHPFKNKIMVYFGDGNVIKLATNSELYYYVNKLLIKEGCSIKFGNRKIRKTGLNFIYRRVEKNFSKYRVAGQHSFEVFQRNYLRFLVGESKRTLSKAITVMSDYFHNRPITDNIEIVCESSDSWQKVPNGSCASDGNDVQATVYNRSIHGLNKRFGIEKAKYCADFSACLWCEHYRCIADPEHVWRLLSYRDYILEDMSSSINDFVEVGNQKKYQRLLTNKVNEILSVLDNKAPGCRESGEKLLFERGVHPDWQLVNTTTSINLENE